MAAGHGVLNCLYLSGDWQHTWELGDEGPAWLREMNAFVVDADGNLCGNNDQLGRTQNFTPRVDGAPNLLIRESTIAPPPWS